jgi:hypothetical protein
MKNIVVSIAAALLVPLAALPLSAGCAQSYDSEAITNVRAPDYDIYATYLDGFINTRCGTLDCHGATGRAFRHYGYRGLRRLEGKAAEFDAGRSDGGAGAPRNTGTGATTRDETLANYAGIIALDPENLARVVALNGNNVNDVAAAATKWLFLAKALGRPVDVKQETNGHRHKGGNAFGVGDLGYECTVLWLRAPQKPNTWREASPPAGDAGATPSSRAAPGTPLEKDYADYLDKFDKECKGLEDFR